METERLYDSNSVKELLEDYVLAEEDIDGEIERLEYFASKMISIGSQNMNGMPRASSSSTDRMADMLARKEELEESIRDSVRKQAEARRRIEAVVRKLRKVERRSVIRLKYLDRTEWDDVLEVMYGKRDDFDDRYDTYRRAMYRHHEDALAEMAKVMNAMITQEV